MEYIDNYSERLKLLTDSSIESKYKDSLSLETINQIKDLRNQISEVLSQLTDREDLPNWFVESLHFETQQFIQLITGPISSLNAADFSVKFDKMRKAYVYGISNEFNHTGLCYPFPILNNFIQIRKVKENSNEHDTLIVDYENRIKDLKANFDQNVGEKLNNLQTLEEQLKISTALANKEVGRLGVKNYAEIFATQALEHSIFIRSKKESDENDRGTAKKYNWGFGKAQRWLFFALFAFAGLIYLFTKIDYLFKIDNSSTYTPAITVHIISRFLLISLLIFVISFAFKQFRINMHLYTLNKHRANTLKSFEYLSRAPDKLEAQSYNAILMEVAKAIYESGQTGYIATAETNNDIPSIIDMTKIINPPKPGG